MGSRNRFLTKEQREARAKALAAKREEEKKAKANKPYVSPYERKFGKDAEEKRLKSSGLSTKKKRSVRRPGGRKTNEEIFGKENVEKLKIKHSAWKEAKKKGTLKEWEKKYHSDRIKAGKSRYGN